MSAVLHVARLGLRASRRSWFLLALLVAAGAVLTALAGATRTRAG
jgi:hypothetical protein